MSLDKAEGAGAGFAVLQVKPPPAVLASPVGAVHLDPAHGLGRAAAGDLSVWAPATQAGQVRCLGLTWSSTGCYRLLGSELAHLSQNKSILAKNNSFPRAGTFISLIVLLEQLRTKAHFPDWTKLHSLFESYFPISGLWV